MEIAATELRLGLPGSDNSDKPVVVQQARNKKRGLQDSGDEVRSKGTPAAGEIDQENAPQAKAQVVGWPPIRSYRKNNFQAKKQESDSGGLYVKVSMDGAPYLRKVDLKLYNGYPDLLKALENMFSVFTIGKISGKEGCNASEYAPTYEDKDGDWMLVGDVPWDMFISSCKRLRIMKGFEARGLGSTISNAFTH